MPAIETKNLTRQFGDVVAVEDLNLTVESGEIYGFLGPNGAGKTTTINMLLSLVHPTSGSAHIFGDEVGENIRTVHDRIGVLPAHTELYDRLSARKHLEFVIGVKSADNDPEQLLERVGIPDAIDRPAGDFSSGMAQRLKLAMALVGDPDLLILDEPTTGLDPNGAREMRTIIREENERGATVFFSSHIMEQVEAVCDRVGILHNGTLVAEDTIEELRASVEGDARLSVTVEGDLTVAVERIQALNPVTAVEATENIIHTSLVSIDGKGEVMNEIAQSDLRIVDFELDEESLEDLFASVTGGRRTAPAPGEAPGTPHEESSEDVEGQREEVPSAASGRGR